MVDITEIIGAVVSLVIAVVSTFLVPYIKQKVDAEKLEKWKNLVEIAVNAAEQIYNTANAGEEKKNYVHAWLVEQGITYDEKTVDTLIEAAVSKLNQQLT